jgi:hypothetical protein
MGWSSIKAKINKYTGLGLIVALSPLIGHALDAMDIYSLFWGQEPVLSGYWDYLVNYIYRHPIRYYSTLFVVTGGLFFVGYCRSKSSPFSISWDNDRSPYYEKTMEHPRIEYKTLRVMVRNKSSEPIGRFWVSIKSLTPQPNALYAFGVPLSFSDLIPFSGQGRIILSHQEIFIDIASLKTDWQLARTALLICHADQENSQEVNLDLAPYTFTLEARGQGRRSKEIQMRLDTENGELRAWRIDGIHGWIRKQISHIQYFWKKVKTANHFGRGKWES